MINPKLVFFGLTFVAVALEVVGDVFLKKWAIQSKDILLWLGLLIYMVGSIFWIISLKFETLSKAISIFTILNLIVVVLVGVMYFKEDLSVTNKIGIALGVLSILLIEL
jgi:multidrug transporter EmrE-like cation transporter